MRRKRAGFFETGEANFAFYCLGRTRSRTRGAKIVNDAIEGYANLNVGLPEGPPKYLYGEREECRQVLKRAGFDGTSMSYETRTVEWRLPDAGGCYFEAERNAGVRTAGILARQSPEALEAIRIALENGNQTIRARETNSSYQWRPMWSSYRNG